MVGRFISINIANRAIAAITLLGATVILKWTQL